DPRFASAPERIENREALDAILTEWTSSMDHYEAAHTLQAAGVPAGPVLDARDVFSDPHLAARKFFDRVQHPPETGVGDRPQLGRPWRFSQFKVPTPAPGPRLGEANDYVLKEVLGLSDAEVAAMAEEAVIGSTPVGGRVPNPVPAEEQLRLGRVVLLDREYRKRLGLD